MENKHNQEVAELRNRIDQAVTILEKFHSRAKNHVFGVVMCEPHELENLKDILLGKPGTS